MAVLFDGKQSACPPRAPSVGIDCTCLATNAARRCDRPHEKQTDCTPVVKQGEKRVSEGVWQRKEKVFFWEGKGKDSGRLFLFRTTLKTDGLIEVFCLSGRSCRSGHGYIATLQPWSHATTLVPPHYFSLHWRTRTMCWNRPQFLNAPTLRTPRTRATTGRAMGGGC